MPLPARHWRPGPLAHLTLESHRKRRASTGPNTAGQLDLAVEGCRQARPPCWSAFARGQHRTELDDLGALTQQAGGCGSREYSALPARLRVSRSLPISPLGVPIRDEPPSRQFDASGVFASLRGGLWPTLPREPPAEPGAFRRSASRTLTELNPHACDQCVCFGFGEVVGCAGGHARGRRFRRGVRRPAGATAGSVVNGWCRRLGWAGRWPALKKWLLLDGSADCAQMLAKAQGGRVLAFGGVGAELYLGA